MLDDADESGRPPFAVVRPLLLRGLLRLTALPCIFLENEDGDVVLHRDALEYVKACLSAYELGTIERDVNAIARLYDFYRVFWRGDVLPDDDLDYLIYAYLAWRHSGTLTEDGTSRLGGLRWKPLAYEGLRAEFSALHRYFRFCSMTCGHVALGTMRKAIRIDGTPLNRMHATAAMKERDFFVHLTASREYWARRHDNGFAMPPVSRPVRGRHGHLRHVMAEEEVWQIIRNERNPVYRAIWLVGAFGGIRISEQLNAWQCDVLPASSRRLLFQADGVDSIMVLRADPVNSRFLGDLGKAEKTRAQYLLGKYGMLPRSELSTGDPLFAGWKGTLYLQAQLRLNEVFWLNPQAAALFAQCAREIREFHRVHRTSDRHPYFYVNIADPTAEHRGGILKMSNVQKAWERACSRCDLEPYRWGRNIHGLRHFYKERAKSMGFGPDEIQIMMGHKTIESQDIYGRSAKSIAKRIKELCPANHQIEI